MSAAPSIRLMDSTGPLTRQERLAIESRIKRSGLHSTAVRLLMEIAELAGFGRSPRGCFATTVTLLERLGNPVKPRQAGNLLRELEKIGWIIVLRVGGSQSRFARRHILLGPRCLNDPTPAPSNPMTVHLAIPYGAPSNPVPALPPTGEESRKTTTTEPRESLSFSSRPNPEPQNAPTPETSPAVPPQSVPVAASEFEPAVLNALAGRVAALGLPGLPSPEAASAKIISFRRKLPGWSPAEILGRLSGAVDDAENRLGGKNPVRTWAWFENPMMKSPDDKVYTPGTRKPPVTPPVQEVARRRSDDGQKPPERMTVQELDQEILEAREALGQARKNQDGMPTNSAKRAVQPHIDLIGATLVALERERAARPNSDENPQIIKMG